MAQINMLYYVMNRPLTFLQAFLLAVFACIFSWQNSFAQGQISIVRDAEIEALVQQYAKPIMKAAGLSQNAVKIHIVNNKQFNAFITGNDMYLHTGLLLQAETPNEVMGVIAHELGHITGGHQLRLVDKLEQAQKVAQVSTLLGVGLGALGVANDNADAANAGFGVIGGGQRLAQRTLLAYQREEEVAADRAAMNYLEIAMQSGKGMLDILTRLAKQLDLHKNNLNPYLLTHPQPRNRIKNISSSLKNSKYYNKTDSENAQKNYDRIRMKISAYIDGEKHTNSLIKNGDLHPQAKLYGKAIVQHLYGSPKKAVQLIDELIEADPQNPYSHEMKGEILLRSGKGAQASESFTRAIELDKTNAGFLKIQLGHALLESRNKENVEKAITQLRKGLAQDPDTFIGYRHLARAYGEVGNIPQALLATAELSARTNQTTSAIEYAKRAQKGLKKGTPAWRRAQDIIDIEKQKDEDK